MSNELLIAIVWVLGCIMNTMIARAKGQDSTGQIGAFFVSLVSSPIFAYLYLLAVPDKPKAITQNFT